MQTYLRRTRNCDSREDVLQNQADSRENVSRFKEFEGTAGLWETAAQGNPVLEELWHTKHTNRTTQVHVNATWTMPVDMPAESILRASWDVGSMTHDNLHDLRDGEEVRVLVMDDSPVVRNLIVAMLEDTGAIDHVVQVADAPAAVDAVLDETPHIAILDIKVPGNQTLRNGIDVLRAIKRSKPETQVIMLTNHAIPLYRQTCIDAGASYFFDKSSEFDKLPQAIEEILNQ